ncbi:MAG: aldehyde dehydrogenase family protein [Bacteroidota bacterium]
MTTEVIQHLETDTAKVKSIFEALKSNQFVVGNTTAAQRKEKLNKLHNTILEYRPKIKEALYKDFRKHPSEVDLTEIYPITSELKNVKRKIRRWMADRAVGTPIALLGSSSYIKYEPKGVVSIISPWNFPFNLTFCPLISAIAAGNTVMVKPSEHTPHSSALMKEIVAQVFDSNEVVVVEGGVETAKEVLKLPFNHIFFTGAPGIGKIVMAAAAKHLTSVTLELGGKSPTIVDQSANIEIAAKRIAWGKFVNNGQICIAPDYVFVHQSLESTFVEAVKKYIHQFYSENPSNEPSYARMVNQNHYRRVKSLVEDAIEKGAKVELGNQFDDGQAFITPTVMSNVSNESEIMKQEIFGPVMPIQTFENVTDVVKEINAREKPLALYIYSKNRKNIDYIMNNTRAGGSCINHNAVHFYNHNLPFGGSNNSGIGKGHGHDGFKAFSNARAVLKQHIPNALDVLAPPYDDFKQRLIDLTIKWF